MFFLPGFPFTDTGDSFADTEREGKHLFFFLPLPPAKNNSAIYLQLIKSDDYSVILIAEHLLTRMLLSNIPTLVNIDLALV